MARRLSALLVAVGSVFAAPSLGGADAATARPVYVAVIIDDLGNNVSHGERVIRLPAPVACAILPHTAFAARLAGAAHAARKEVLLHLPMESLDRQPPGPGALEAAMPERERTAMLEYDLSTVPHAVGVNNHMGSKLTQDANAMQTLMQALARRGNLFFVDSRTSPQSLASHAAQESGVPVLVRDVFLDNDPSIAAINARLDELVAIA